jgi:hypothetical protein
MKYIYYKNGYKYQLVKDYKVLVKIYPNTIIETDYLRLDKKGFLTVKKGYAWDGASGPAFDTKNFMRGSLIHDALYQLMRMRLLEADNHRKTADKLLRDMCLEDGMNRIFAWWVWRGVRRLGSPFADPSHAKKVKVAP